MPPTHFLCLPLITPTSRPQLDASLAHLRAITKTGDCKIPDSAYRPLGVLHLTLGVMTLTPDRLKEALQLLQDTDLQALLAWAGNRPRTTMKTTSSDSATSSASSQPSVPAPLSIDLTGLATFPEARKATVLHAKPHDPTTRLYYFALALRQNFLDAGFMQAEDRSLVLHATLVNTVYSKRGEERSGEKGRGQGKIALDARQLVRSLEGREKGEDEGRSWEAVEPFVWASQVEIESVRICKMGAVEVEDAQLGMEYQVVGEKRILNG